MKFRIRIDPACGQVPAIVTDIMVPQLAAGSKKRRQMRIGEVGTVRLGDQRLYVRRQTHSLLLLGPDKGAAWVSAKDYAWGRDFWDDIHRSAWELDGEEEISSYLYLIELALGCGECKRHWLKLVAERPLEDFTPMGYFTWGSARHNDVSESIGKPPVTLEQALGLYPPPG